MTWAGRSSRCRRAAGLALAVTAALAVTPRAFAVAAPVEPAALATDRGLESHVDVPYRPTLHERGENPQLAPVRVRVTRTAQPGIQRVSFIGNVAGEFDLRDFLARDDGGPVTDLPPLHVRIVSRLPEKHGTDLLEREGWWAVSGGTWTWRDHYRAIMIGGFVLWAGVPVVVLTRRALRRRRRGPPAVPAPPPPSLGEQVVAAIRTAGKRTLTTNERAGLELLLIRYLSERLGLAMVPEGDYAATLESLRRNRDTAPVVKTVERWLHAGGEAPARATNAAAALHALTELARDAIARAKSPGEISTPAESRGGHA